MFKLADNQLSNICERVDTCALTGAAAFVAGIKDAEILVNGPLWCYFYALRYLEHAQYDAAKRFFGSQPDNNAVIYGSEKYVLEAIERLLSRNIIPSVLLLESSCSMSLIGDDLAGIAKKAALNFPVVTMDCGGMIGGFAEGYAKAAISILDRFVKNNIVKEDNTVNLLGVTDFYLRGNADTIEICRILKKAGYKVQVTLGCNCTVEQICDLGKAKLNIVINEELGLPIAKYLQDKLDIPYILAGIPYGLDGSLSWLEFIDHKLAAPNLQSVKQEVEEAKGYLIGCVNENSCVWGNLWYENVLVSGPPTIALCLAKALRNEWADMQQLTILCQRKLPQSDVISYCDNADNIYISGIDTESIKNIFASYRPQLILASSSENSIYYHNKHKNFQKCNIAFPANDEMLLAQMPYAGIEGSKYILQNLWNNFIDRRLLQQD